jgi:hypothetical protein
MVRPRSEDHILGIVAFKNGRTSFISKVWTPTDGTDAVSFTRAVVGALRTLSNDTHCTVDDESQSEPNFEAHATRISCGLHSVTISAYRHQGSESAEVSEQWNSIIGH